MEESEPLRFISSVLYGVGVCWPDCISGVGDAKHAIFCSLLRKAFIVVPLTLLLPMAGFGVNGVFLAEPISNAIGGIFC